MNSITLIPNRYSVKSNNYVVCNLLTEEQANLIADNLFDLYNNMDLEVNIYMQVHCYVEDAIVQEVSFKHITTIKRKLVIDKQRIENQYTTCSL